VPEAAVKPGGADDDGVAVRRIAYSLLPVQLGPAIYAKWFRRIVRLVWHALATVEHEIRRDIDDACPGVTGGLRDVTCTVDVDPPRDLRLVLGLVHGGIGGGIHHETRPLVGETCLKRCRIQDIQFR
jgi:hypothetical protein